jgi:hypothetical protein
MAGLDPAIQLFARRWIAGSSPAMTLWYVAGLKFREKNYNARQ